MFDVQSILSEKNPKLSQTLPPLGLYFLQRVVHEPVVNSFLHSNQELNPSDFCLKALDKLGTRLKIYHEEHLRNTPRPIVSSNHPCGGAEGIGLIYQLCQTWGTCKIPANDILGKVKPLESLLVPIDKKNPSRQSLDYLHKTFDGPDPILIFPAGLTARKKGGFMREFPWQPSFVTHSRRYKRDIVPVWVSGQNSKHFYLIHRIRTLFSITFNIEMSLLVDELMRKKKSTLEIHFLPPISPQIPKSWKFGVRDWDKHLAGKIQATVEQYGRKQTNGRY